MTLLLFAGLTHFRALVTKDSFDGIFLYPGVLLIFSRPKTWGLGFQKSCKYLTEKIQIFLRDSWKSENMKILYFDSIGNKGQQDGYYYFY